MLTTTLLLCLKLPSLLQSIKRAAASAAVPARKAADPRRPKPFTGEGDQDQAGAVRRLTNALSLNLELSEVASEKWFVHAMLFLGGYSLRLHAHCCDLIPSIVCYLTRL